MSHSFFFHFHNCHYGVLLGPNSTAVGSPQMNRLNSELRLGTLTGGYDDAASSGSWNSGGRYTVPSTSMVSLL